MSLELIRWASSENGREKASHKAWILAGSDGAEIEQLRKEHSLLS